MDAPMLTALGAAVDHYAADIIEELTLQRERKAMELEDLAARAMTGKVTKKHTHEGRVLQADLGSSRGAPQ